MRRNVADLLLSEGGGLQVGIRNYSKWLQVIIRSENYESTKSASKIEIADIAVFFVGR